MAHAALAFTPQRLAAAGAASRAPPPTRCCSRCRRACATSAASSACCGACSGARAARPRACTSPCAATAQGAAVLARVEPPPRCTDLAATRAALAAAPVWLLGPGREHWEALAGHGPAHARRPARPAARRPGAALRRGAARRDRRAPSAAGPIRASRSSLPRSFESRLELFARADSTEQVLHGAAVLLARLVAWLAAQHAFVRRFRLLMHHETRWQQGDRTPQATALEIALAEPSRDSDHLLRPAARAAGAACSCRRRRSSSRLQAEDIVKRAAPNSELFPTPAERARRPDAPDRAAAGAARRRARCSAWPRVEDHRPERASRAAARRRGRRGRLDASRAAAARRAQRLARRRRGDAARAASCVAAGLAAPVAEPLAERRSRPLLDGRPLSLLSGPERIEAGWWDAEPRRARLLHRRGGRRCAGLDLPRAVAAVEPTARPKAAGSSTAASADVTAEGLRAFSGALRRSA